MFRQPVPSSTQQRLEKLLSLIFRGELRQPATPGLGQQLDRRHLHARAGDDAGKLHAQHVHRSGAPETGEQRPDLLAGDAT